MDDRYQKLLTEYGNFVRWSILHLLNLENELRLAQKRIAELEKHNG